MGRGNKWMLASPVQLPRKGKCGMEGYEPRIAGLQRRLHNSLKQEIEERTP